MYNIVCFQPHNKKVSCFIYFQPHNKKVSCCIYFQPHNKKVSCCIYLAGLAVTDNLFMLNCFELSLYMGLLADYFTDNHCKFAAYLFQVKILTLAILLYSTESNGLALQIKPMLKRSLRPRQIPVSTMQNGICEVTALIRNGYLAWEAGTGNFLLILR